MESEFDTTILKLIKEQILSNPESLYINDLIGIGTIGKVYKIKIPNEKQVFALKVISKIFIKILLLLILILALFRQIL